MGIAFSYPTQSSPVLIWSPTKPPRYPIGYLRDYPRQVRGETAGGAVLVQDPAGPAREIFELVFDHLPQSDRDQAVVFFDTVRKASETFDFTDQKGSSFQVRWWNAFNFPEGAYGRHSGTIQLLKESFA